ncbi:MAG: hypothetical protein KJI71_00435 [Patescibacteria group bacterium]|nr:hypothetical protein [Patescibacteria group bacterium]
MAKKTTNMKNEPRKYDLKIPYELFKVIKNHIENHKELGYSNVSQYLNELIRLDIKRILQEEKERKD